MAMYWKEITVNWGESDPLRSGPIRREPRDDRLDYRPAGCPRSYFVRRRSMISGSCCR
jgi:hypothetical protein